VGVYGHEITYILKALLLKNFREIFPNAEICVDCVGIERDSERQYEPFFREFFNSTMRVLGFFPCREDDQKIKRDAEKFGLIPIVRMPVPIQSLRQDDIDFFNFIMTPYACVEKRLSEKYAKGRRIDLVCNPEGLKLNCRPDEAAEKMAPWVKKFVRCD